jgi:acyl-CoA-dependent ceramide synthase
MTTTIFFDFLSSFLPSPSTPLSSSTFPGNTLLAYIFIYLLVILAIYLTGRALGWISFAILFGERGIRDKRRQLKYTSAFLEFIIYTTGFLWGFPLIQKQEWSWPSSRWWLNTPSTSLETELACYYLMYASRYIAMLAVVLSTERKKDFTEMVFHHLITSVLVILSYWSGFVRVGLVIMVLFDCADPFLHGAKLINYWKEASPKHSRRQQLFSTGADIVFGIFAIAFFLTRIVAYSYVVYSCTYESIIGITQKSTLWEGLKAASLPHQACILLVWVLYGLQWFWWLILWELIKKTLRGEELKDSRSDDDRGNNSGVDEHSQKKQE